MSQLILPDLIGLKINISRKIIHSTLIQEATSGKEVRSAYWSYPRYILGLNFSVLRSASKPTYVEYERLIGFLQRMAGQQDSFLFAIPDDQSVVNMPFGVGNGTTTAFQLQRTLVPASDISETNKALWKYFPSNVDGFEPIYNTSTTPAPPVISVNGSVVTTGYSITNGLVTFTTAPLNGYILTWTGSYYWRCRVNTDDTEFQRFLNGYYEASIELITVK